MREMGRLSGVEIEPEQQTKLLDASVSMAGVIGGGVPGGTCPLFLLFFCQSLFLILSKKQTNKKLAGSMRCGYSFVNPPRTRLESHLSLA